MPSRAPIYAQVMSRPAGGARAVTTPVAALVTVLLLVPVSVAPSHAAHDPSADGGVVGAAATASATRARWLVRYAPGTDMVAAGRTLRAHDIRVQDTVTRANIKVE